MNQPITLQTHTIVGTETDAEGETVERPGPHLLITGGVHGDEYEPMVAIRRLMEEFDPATLKGRVTLVPLVNEAAFARRSRTAEDGLDLARVCPGNPEGSETERIAVALSELIRSADFYIDLHTGGVRYEILSLVGYGLHEDETVLNHQREMARAFNMPIIWGTSARHEGRSLSVARDAGIPAIYTEFTGGAKCSEGGVQMLRDGCLNVARYLGMLERTIPDSLVEYIVEDDRDDSGHLQTQMPAPADGFFEARVRLGDFVERNQIIGKVFDPLGQRGINVAAPHDGMVLMLQTFPAATAGESLGAILPISGPGEVFFQHEEA